MLLLKLSFISLWLSVYCSNNFITVSKKYPTVTLQIFRPKPDKVFFTFVWDSVPNWDEENPVIGYRLVFWEMRTPKKEIFVGDELKIVDDDNPLTPRIPVDLPKIYEVSANDRKVSINDIKPGIWYEYAALAFTKKGEGPLSSPTGVKVGKPEENEPEE